MNIKELKTKNLKELSVMVNDLKKEALYLRFQKINSQITDQSKIRKTRRTIAKVLTLINNFKLEEKNA